MNAPAAGVRDAGVNPATGAAKAQPLGGFAALPVADLHHSPANPRERLNEINELAASIAENGLIQPIVVQRVPGRPGFQILAGHRRHAAVRHLGWATVPCIIRRDMLPDEELVTMLVENGQRAGLDPIEEARALKKLLAMGLTQAEAAVKIGRSQPYVASRTALLSLPLEEQEALRNREITLGAAKSKAMVDSGRSRPTAKGKKSAQHLDINHDLGTRARSRCQRLGHKSKGAASVGGIACGECWESVIRADERTHLHDQSNDRGRCVLCDVRHDPDQVTP